MSTGKRKISIRKVIQTLVTIVVVAGFTVAILSADRSQSRKLLKGVDIHVSNEHIVHFLDEEEIRKMLFTDRHLAPERMVMGELDIHKMENIVRTNPWISDAQVFVDNERIVHINASQRVPVVRIFEANGHSYYLDGDMKSMPVSERYVHYTPLITNVPALRDDSRSYELKGTMLSLVNHIVKSKFWNAQIAQIVIGRDKTFELIPVLGNQRILLGDTSRIPEKLNNLLAFYQQVENKVGWEKYEVIDLRYKGQVIASPALSWKIPVDRALLNMNWVKAVMESVPKDEKDESVTNALDTGIAAMRMSTDNVPTPVLTADARAGKQPVAASAPPAPVRPQTAVTRPATVPAKPAAAIKPKATAAVKPKPATAKPVVQKPKATVVKPVQKPGNTAAKKPAATTIKPAAALPKKKVTPPKKEDKKTAVKPKPKPAAKPDKKPAKPVKPAAHH